MDIPLANIVEININTGSIINDNSNNLIYADVEPKQLINQTATLEHIIYMSHRQSNATFSTTPLYPNSGIRVINNFNYKIKITCLFCSFWYFTLFIVSLILLFNRRRQNNN
jgi:hypothetical protein